MMGQFSQKVLGQARKTRGYLEKRSSGLLASWQRRYFLIREEGLSYYGDETLGPVRKTIPIQEIKNIKLVGAADFELVTKKRIYELRAEDEATRDLWVASLNILVNHKEWTQSPTDPKKDPKRQSKTKKLSSRTASPPQLSKASSSLSARGRALEGQFTAEGFWTFVCLPRVAEQWSREGMRGKALLLKEARGCYFLLSCKSLVAPQEDPELLPEELVHPYDFNCLYFLEFAKLHAPEVVEVCKCAQIEAVESEPGCIRVSLPGRSFAIRVEQKRMEVVDLQSIIRKLRASAAIGREYHNTQGIKIRRNIDPLIYKFESKQMTIEQIAAREFDTCLADKDGKEKEGKETKEGKESPTKSEFKRQLEAMRRSLKEIVNCCEAKGAPAAEFKQSFVVSFHERVYHYVQRGWGLLGKGFSSFEINKVILALQEVWRLAREWVGESGVFEGAVALQRVLVQRYEEQILAKIDSCAQLGEEELLEEVRIEVKGETATVYFSNKLFGKFHLDIRLVLHEFSEMPVHERALEDYLALFSNCFRYLCEQAARQAERWRQVGLLVGTCNEIEVIKASLFQEMFEKVTRDYPQAAGRLKREVLRELQGELNAIQIALVKKLFVLTFSDLDRKLLSRPYDRLSVPALVSSILAKLNALPKLNRYVRRNVLEAAFEEICYFYYTSIIKFTRGEDSEPNEPQEEGRPADFFARKIAEDIRLIGDLFDGSIPPEKITAHLRDLALLKDFLVCEAGQVKRLCRSLKKQFGNSFTEGAVRNLLALREGPAQLREGLLVECSEIVKNSADTPEEISLVSSSRESFLENWNNTRSRKSTLTLSLHEFHENQHALHSARQQAHAKQGFLLRRRPNRDAPDLRAFFAIRAGELQEHPENNPQGEVVAAYDLRALRKCYLHPEKNYIFLIEFPDARLQLKAETAEEAREWVRNIYEEVSALGPHGEKEKEKEKAEREFICGSGGSQKEKDPSTMDSYQRNKEHSNANSPKTKRHRPDKNQSRSPSPERPTKVEKEKAVPDDGCIKCSKGFFF